MIKYAQIDLSTGVCISVSYLSDEVDAAHLIPLSETDDVQPCDIYDSESWIRPEPEPIPEPEPSPNERIEQLEAETAELWYDTMLKDARIAEHDTEIADLWYTMMTRGV